MSHNEDTGWGDWELEGVLSGGAVSWPEKVLSEHVLSEQTPEEVKCVSDTGPLFSSTFLCSSTDRLWAVLCPQEATGSCGSWPCQRLNLSCEGRGKGCSSCKFLAPGSLDGAATARFFCFHIPQNLLLPVSVAKIILCGEFSPLRLLMLFLPMDQTSTKVSSS